MQTTQFAGDLLLHVHLFKEQNSDLAIPYAVQDTLVSKWEGVNRDSRLVIWREEAC